MDCRFRIIGSGEILREFARGLEYTSENVAKQLVPGWGCIETAMVLGRSH
jgi:hypothetical protein